MKKNKRINYKLPVPAISVLIILMFIRCTGNNRQAELENSKTDKRLEIIGKYELNVKEPSGLTFSENGEFLWTVSDETNKLYKITTLGEVIDSVNVEGIDLEGVSKYNDNKLFVICERERSILVLDSNLTINKKLYLDLKGKKNSGIEGITYNKNNGHTFVINEKDPALLVELDDSLHIISQKELDFADDVSGLDYNPRLNELWIVSDLNRTLFRCNTLGVILDSYKVDIRQLEGVAIDFDKNMIYLVSDFTENLYVFKIKTDEPSN
jgi:uncharacterized protein YjiK